MTDIEKAILQAIIKENRNSYPFLEDHLPYLYVINREYTSFGIYTDFGYSKEFNSTDLNILLSSGEALIADNLENELAYVLFVTNGKIDLLEIATNGNELINEDNKLKLIP